MSTNISNFSAILPMVYHVSNNKTTRHEVNHNYGESQEKTSKSKVYRQNWNIWFGFIGMTHTMINCSGQCQEEFIGRHFRS